MKRQEIFKIANSRALQTLKELKILFPELFNMDTIFNVEEKREKYTVKSPSIDIKSTSYSIYDNKDYHGVLRIYKDKSSFFKHYKIEGIDLAGRGEEENS